MILNQQILNLALTVQEGQKCLVYVGGQNVLRPHLYLDVVTVETYNVTQTQLSLQ